MYFVCTILFSFLLFPLLTHSCYPITFYFSTLTHTTFNFHIISFQYLASNINLFQTILTCFFYKDRASLKAVFILQILIYFSFFNIQLIIFLLDCKDLSLIMAKLSAENWTMYATTLPQTPPATSQNFSHTDSDCTQWNKRWVISSTAGHPSLLTLITRAKSQGDPLPASALLACQQASHLKAGFSTTSPTLIRPCNLQVPFYPHTCTFWETSAAP